MMEKMIFGRFVPADSAVHRMDPRSKLIVIFLFVCIIFLANNWMTYALYLLSLKIENLLDFLQK